VCWYVSHILWALFETYPVIFDIWHSSWTSNLVWHRVNCWWIPLIHNCNCSSRPLINKWLTFYCQQHYDCCSKDSISAMEAVILFIGIYVTSWTICQVYSVKQQIFLWPDSWWTLVVQYSYQWHIFYSYCINHFWCSIYLSSFSHCVIFSHMW
jgi:hypothetical protein